MVTNVSSRASLETPALVSLTFRRSLMLTVIRVHRKLSRLGSNAQTMLFVVQADDRAGRKSPK